MTQLTFTDGEWYTIACALRVASEQYRRDADNAQAEGLERIANQFRQQAADAFGLSVVIEQEA